MDAEKDVPPPLNFTEAVVCTDGEVRDIQMQPSGLFPFGPGEKFETPKPAGTRGDLTKVYK
jgi:hypothetical protein